MAFTTYKLWLIYAAVVVAIHDRDTKNPAARFYSLRSRLYANGYTIGLLYSSGAKPASVRRCFALARSFA